MTSPYDLVTRQPFVRYLMKKPLYDAPVAGARSGDAPADPHAHLENIENSWLAGRARQVNTVGGVMSAMRLMSNNTPLLAVPDSTAARVTDFLAGVTKPAAAVTFALKDVACKALEDVTRSATWGTRAPRWLARVAASASYMVFEGLAWADVKAWMSRPDYEFPASCDPHDLNPPKSCPVLGVGQRAETFEPVMGALLIGALLTTSAYVLYRIDLRRVRPAAPAAVQPAQAPRADEGDVEQGVREPLLRSASGTGSEAGHVDTNVPAIEGASETEGERSEIQPLPN